ncbi:hypothetical protein WR25_05868 isoform C [Diploscapter pachys]|uniref:Dynamin-type G domain-containing protein n=1 Tax=Diploscapter pachys TaxID=2018661 RepID=A0A2A2L927_9BILA|nr:hypothetical protein WR25_05868 isoform C [Diploscapter pachys]
MNRRHSIQLLYGKSQKKMKNPQNGYILNPEFTSIPVAKAHPPKRRDIQGLRAWAIILVLLFHYFPKYFPNGYVGVDMFFVISGYLIGMIVCKFEVLGRQALQTFYYRRAKRIFPLYYLAIGLIFVVMYVCLPEPSYDINTSSGMKAIFLLTNMKSELDPEQDYAKLLADAEDLFTHTWSLCVEIKWYFLVPFLFMAQRRLPISAMRFFIGIGSISLFYHLISTDTIAFNSTFARVWQFCAGITAYVATVYEKKNLRPEVNNNDDKETRLLLNDQDENENQDVQIMAEDRRLLPYIAYFLFALIMVTFSWSTEEPHHLRIEMSFLTTILIAIGEYYEIWILSNALMNYIGNISYSLYLVHWPIFVTTKYFAPDNNLALLIGIGLSFLTASVIYFAYEQPYLKLGAVKIFVLIGLLFVASLILTQPSIITNRIDYERKFGVYDLNLEKGDPSKNLSVAVALNYYEGMTRVGASNAVENCTHVDFGSKEIKAPFGWCKMPGRHTGKVKFLVIGNSYACNQGHIVYEAFQNLTREFHFFCLVACEPLMEKQDGGCHLLTQWHDVYNQIKPDVLFMLHRPIMGMAQLDETKPIEQDDVYQQHVRMISWYLKQDGLLKIYIQHALPRCLTYCVGYINKWILEENKPLRFAGDRFTIHNEKWERIRFEHLVKMKTCQGKCELFDYYPEMLNKKGEFSLYDENTNLAYLDNTQHFSKFGRDKVKVVYKRLAEKFAKQYPQLDSVSKKSPICCMSGRMMSLVNPSQPAYGGDSPQALSLNGKTKDEPLGRFRVAKRELGQIFNNLKETVQELESVYNAADEKIIQKEHKDGVKALQESIKTILDTFRRDNMKCVFFGRTSNGKSTTVNAMLHEKILPQGMGHTTCCFLQVQGCDEEQGYLQLDDNPKRIDLDMLGKMGHALSSENSDLPAMGQDSLLRVFYPKGKGATTNRLLQNDVVILDSPGVDLSPEFDAWIDKHCLDADVFVLVCNAEATLTQAEKNFFLRVAKKLSKPNVFILNNRWDASAAEMDNVENVKKQHMTRFQQFLVNELEVCTEREVAKRIFFVSSREILDSRLKERGLVNKAYQMDGYQERALEFQDFERHFEQCISRFFFKFNFLKYYLDMFKKL